MSKLAGVYEKDLGITTVWNTALKNGNPVRSDLVTKYMAFTREEQKKAGVSVKQAPVLLQENLATVIAPMRITLQGSTDPLVRATVARDIAVFTVVAFSTTKRGDELTRTLIQRILRLPNRSGLLFNFQWGKTLRDGADHLLTVPYTEDFVATCPVKAVEQFIAVGTHLSWDMTTGYLFPAILPAAEVGGKPIRGQNPSSASQMTAKKKTVC